MRLPLRRAAVGEGSCWTPTVGETLRHQTNFDGRLAHRGLPRQITGLAYVWQGWARDSRLAAPGVTTLSLRRGSVYSRLVAYMEHDPGAGAQQTIIALYLCRLGKTGVDPWKRAGEAKIQLRSLWSMKYEEIVHASATRLLGEASSTNVLCRCFFLGKFFYSWFLQSVLHMCRS